ncbi:hypothetical protein [Qipengyuania xiamenensis]|nr:hypothetical protein [Qipengyuania xiamenensis]
MPRVSNQFAAAFAALAITIVSMQMIVTVPPAQASPILPVAIA